MDDSKSTYGGRGDDGLVHLSRILMDLDLLAEVEAEFRGGLSGPVRDEQLPFSSGLDLVQAALDEANATADHVKLVELHAEQQEAQDRVKLLYTRWEELEAKAG